jgi:hypothetical protein
MKKLLFIIIALLYSCDSGTQGNLDINYAEKSKPYPIRILEGQPILVENGDFESNDAINYWHHNMSERIIENAGRNNTKALTISLSGVDSGGFMKSIHNDSRLSDILLEGWIKTDNLQYGHAVFKIECFNFQMELNEKGKEIYGYLSGEESNPVTGTTPWTKITMHLIIPKETAEIRIHGQAKCWKRIDSISGTAYFDDITVKGLAVYEDKGVNRSALVIPADNSKTSDKLPNRGR